MAINPRMKSRATNKPYSFVFVYPSESAKSVPDPDGANAMISPTSEAEFEQHCNVLLKTAAAKCSYDEWSQVRDGLVKICGQHGKRFKPIDGTGDFLVLEDWFGQRELCVKEARENFVSEEFLVDVQRFVKKLPGSYVVLISPDDVLAPVRYSILIAGFETRATVSDCKSTKAARNALQKLSWFRAESS